MIELGCAGALILTSVIGLGLLRLNKRIVNCEKQIEELDASIACLLKDPPKTTSNRTMWDK